MKTEQSVPKRRHIKTQTPGDHPKERIQHSAYILLKLMVKDRGLGGGFSLFGSRQRPVADYCQHDNELPGSVKGGGSVG